MTKIKICGLFRPEDIEFVNEAKPDFIGFVFADSRRRVTKEQAERLRSNLDPGIKPVGVFVNARPEEIAGSLDSGIIDMAQLHGSEDEAYLASLRSMLKKSMPKSTLKFMTEYDGGFPLMKAIRVERAEDVIRAQNNPADYLLLDHGAGGTGKTFDWRFAQNCARPFFLAGGIHEGNVETAIKELNPYAVDVSSGVETNGVKDREKIIEIVRRVRDVEGQIRDIRRTIHSGNLDE